MKMKYGTKILAALALLCAAQFADAQVYTKFGPANGILKGSTSTYQTSAAVAADVVSLFSACSGVQYLGADGACHSVLATPVSAANGGTGEAGSITGLTKANGTSAFTAGTNTDVITLWSGTCNSGTYLNGAGTCTTPTGTSSGANPTALVGTSAVNGVAGTFLRSDGAPAIDPAIVPSWTGFHTWTKTGTSASVLTINDNTAGNASFINFSDTTGGDNFHIDFNGDTSFMLLGGANSTNGGVCNTNGALAPYWCLSGQGVIPFSFGTNGIERMRIGGNGAFTFNAQSTGGQTNFTFNARNGNNAASFVQGAGSGTAFGVVIQAGTTSADYSLLAQSQSATTFFDVRGDGLIYGRGPIAAALVNMTPDEGTFTETYATGFSTTPTGTVVWSANGNQVCLILPTLSATSNATGFTITGVPAAIQPARTQRAQIAGIQDNGVINGAGGVSITNSGTLTLTANGSTTGFTSTGTKGISASTFCYILN